MSSMIWKEDEGGACWAVAGEDELLPEGSGDLTPDADRSVAMAGGGGTYSGGVELPISDVGLNPVEFVAATVDSGGVRVAIDIFEEVESWVVLHWRESSSCRVLVTIHPHFSLPPQLSPLHQQYQHQHQQRLPSMSTICQQHQLPITPPLFTPDTIHHSPWRTNEQSRSSQRWNQALGLFFHSWTLRPCSDPLCRAPHQQPHPLQTTSPSPCSPTTLHLPSMPSSGSPGIQIALCREKDLRPFKSPVSAHFPQTVQLVLNDVAASPVEDTPQTSLLALKISPFPLSRKNKQQVQATAKAKCLGIDADPFLHSTPSSPSLLFRPTIPIPWRKLAQPLITPYQEDIPGKPPADLLDLRRQLLLSFPKIAKPLSDP